MQTPYLLQPGGVFQFGGVAFMVDKAVFGEHRGHRGAPQYLEVRSLFTPILQAAPGGNGLMQDVLELFRFDGHAAVIDEGLETGAAASVDVDADEQIGPPAVRGLTTSAQGRVRIPSAAHFNLHPGRPEHLRALFRDGQGQILLFQAVSDGPRIRPPVARVNEDFDCDQLSLLTTFWAPLYNPTDASPIATPDTIPCTTSPGETRKTPATTPRARANSGANLAGIPVLFAASTSAMISPTSAASSKPTM